MAATAIPLNGTSLVMRISEDSGTTWQVFGFPTSATITANMETRDLSTKNECGWRALGPGQRTWSMNGDGLITYEVVTDEVTPINLFKYFNNRDVIDVEVTTWDCTAGIAIVGDPSYTGKAYLTSYEQTGGVEDNATYTFTFEGTGVLTETTNA